MTMKHILFPTDFSDAAEHAFATALELARRFDSRLTLLHVWSVPSSVYAEALTWPIDDMQRGARKYLDAALESARRLYPKTDALLREGREWKQILEVVDELGCDLVVMGTHGRKGLSRIILGNVAEKIVRLSHVPVLTVGAPKDPSE